MLDNHLLTVAASAGGLRASIGGRVLLLAMAVALIEAGPAVGQGLTGDEQLEDLRRRTPAGDNDTRIIDNWLQIEFAKITAPNSSGGFRKKLHNVRNEAATTPAFRDALAERIGAFAQSELAKGPDLPLPAAQELVWAVIDADDPRAQPGLAEALRFGRQPVRYLGAKGLQALRDRIATEVGKVQPFIDMLKQAGVQETNGVVVERIYRAMMLPGAPAGVVAAMTEILDARLDRYRQGAVLVDQAEPAAIEFLANVTLTQDRGARVVRRLAVLLRLDVERYAAGRFVAGQQDAVERRIYVCEGLIEQIAGPGPGAGKAPNVRGVMVAGGVAVGASMKFELNNWVGAPGTQGVLNTAPWSVPVGAP